MISCFSGYGASKMAAASTSASILSATRSASNSNASPSVSNVYGGFNQPIMCGGEPRVMLQKIRGKADPAIYTIQICIPKHALSLIFSFTNGTEWDGPYRLQFQVSKSWRNKPTEFFTEETRLL
ncbi:hypothetical protein K7X08_000231 [Anisodus acutangulus]|uniref:PIFI-like Ig-like domain-containing protein n=1 Tax=Anisodus acutangulus TaxID=402998 RepID=A0A9Q1M6C5_9SOLA|nr:hypothetical protein K7X08_000231 [Anisodus acutangulus]